MFLIKTIFITYLVSMAAIVRSAPVETESPMINEISDTSKSPNLSTTPPPSTTIIPTTTTTTSTITLTPSPTTTSTTPATTVNPTTTSVQTSSAPAPDGFSKETNPTSPMTLSSPSQQETATKKSNQQFTCTDRSLGYYADIEEGCSVYHFCLSGDYNGNVVYQRITYKCLNDTIFDQQALDCVEASKMSSPCQDSQLYYDSSNIVLRQAVVGNQVQQGAGTGNQTTTT